MFPTFISILDIQSWWEVPSIAHFCSLFRTAFNLLDFDIEDLEEALLTDGTEEPSWLQELIVRLLTGCLPNNEISTFNYQMFLRRLFREKCKEHDRYNPFNTDIDFQLLPLRTKVDILYALCDFRLDAEDVLEQLKNLEADSLRVEPLGYDNVDSAYWYFYGTRLYREDFKTKNNKKAKSVWQVVCFTQDDWFQLAKKFKKSQSKCERQLYRTLTENFLPELPRLFCEKERLARKRLLESQPRRTSSRLDLKRKQETELAEKTKLEVIPEKDKEILEENRKKKELETRRQEAYERRARLREQDRESENSESRYEMAGNKKREKKSKVKQQNADSIKDHALKNINKTTTRSADKLNKSLRNSKETDLNNATTVGRQTNNSLASATGQIVIQPVSNPHRKKLKTSQVFRQTDEDLQTGMHKILDYVKNHDEAWPFVDPVEEEYAPNYYSIIRKPMDLQRMEERLDSGYYKSYSRFRSDFQLIVDNCRLYNGVDNEYTEMVGNLLTVFEKATERYLDQVTSSDEEIAVEYPKIDAEEKIFNSKQKKMVNNRSSSTLSRKSTLAASSEKKQKPVSEDSNKHYNPLEIFDEIKTIKKSSKPVEEFHSQKKNSKVKPNRRKPQKTSKIERKSRIEQSPVRTRSRSRSYSSFSHDGWSSSPPPSWPPSSPEDQLDLSKQKNSKISHFSDEETQNKFKEKSKQQDKWEEEFSKQCNDQKPIKTEDKPVIVPKQKDKHSKLRETIEKLKAKSEIFNKLKENNYEDSDNEKTKENRDFLREQHDNKNRKHDIFKNKFKHKNKSKNEKHNLDLDDENSTVDSIHSENKKYSKHESMKSINNKNAAIEALTLATEQTLKDINKWLDDTPRLSEFSSASNSPSHYIGTEEFDSISTKVEHDFRKKLEKPLSKKDSTNKDIKRRIVQKDPTKFIKKREIQRTIDRLQPGKSKGNLLSNIQNTNKTDDIFPLGPLSKVKDTKNSLIVKTDESTPKLSLGSVLDSFGKHKFVDDVKKEEELSKSSSTKSENIKHPLANKTDDIKHDTTEIVQLDKKKEKSDEKISTQMDSGKATPNLSAWFKAFGAPKVPSNQKKIESKPENKETEKLEEVSVKPVTQKVIPPEASPNPDSPAILQGQPIPRQRKMSTGSTVSERSSFSQDMDSPRIGIDERLGAYPAPYPSPLHRSPSGASPIMASPRPDVSPKSAYPTVNGQIRVGFYQDTVSTKSSPDKSCSPKDNPQSPYPHYSEHVYAPSTTENTAYSYNNPSYYSQMSNYPTPMTPSYSSEQNNSPSYYDTSKPLTDQYQSKSVPNYNSVASPGYHQPASPAQIPSPADQQAITDYDTFRQHQGRLTDKQQNTIFPVKKRVYNESEQEQQSLYLMPQQAASNSTSQSSQVQEIQSSDRSTPQQCINQNIPNPRSGRDAPTSQETNYTPPNIYNYSNDGYPINSSEQPLDLNSRPDGDVAYYGKPANKTGDLQPPLQNIQNNEMMMHYTDTPEYRNADVNLVTPKIQNMENRLNSNLDVSTGYKPEVSIPRPSYSTPSTLNMDQSLGLRGNLTNLSHIVDRFSTENMYYAEKGLAASHIYNKPMVSSASSLPIFSQPYGHEMQTQATQPSMYNRQITELQSSVAPSKTTSFPQQEKKSKRRKSNKTSTPTTTAVDTAVSSASNQGFQSYTGLKNAASMEPSAISLKTASVVPGSAFNFGPSPSGLALSSGLYGDKDTYPNFLEDYRTAPNYYMAAAAAAAHHRATPETSDKQARTAHQPTPAPAGYPFIGAPQPRPPSYPLSGPFIPPHQAPPLMDASSPLYQQYLQAGVLHQGLLGPPGAYPPGYHPALSMRQPFDSMTRPSWL